jgi:crotonobetainyl-CoA:carnitine CoA-transferase CaiB-like acyl-CoA transferase
MSDHTDREPAREQDGESFTATPGALEGIHVLDLTRVLSGPFATMTLADLGADVIKIEQPGTGDDTRQWGPPFQGDQSAYFLSVNRNKRSVALDLKSDEGRQAARVLADRADIIVENFRPGTAARLGLGYEEISQTNPRVVYASISGYGQTGPDAGRPGYDAIAQARSGLMSVTGERDGRPVRVGVSSTDLTAGMWALVGILAALYRREQTGAGQWVDISLLDGQVSWLTYVASGYFATGDVPRRYGSAHPTIAPYQGFATADGDLMVAVGNDGLWTRFAPAVGLGALVDDPRFMHNPERVTNRDELVCLVAERLTTRSTAEWIQILDKVGVPVGPINTVDEVMIDPQVLSRGMVIELEHPTAGRLKLVGSPLRLSVSPTTVRRPPPLLGEHTDEVLAELDLPRSGVQR